MKKENFVHYHRDTCAIHQGLTIGGLYSSREHIKLEYIGRSMSDGRLEFMTQEPVKRERRKIRMDKAQYDKDIIGVLS